MVSSQQKDLSKPLSEDSRLFFQNQFRIELSAKNGFQLILLLINQYRVQRKEFGQLIVQLFNSNDKQKISYEEALTIAKKILPFKPNLETSLLSFGVEFDLN